MKKVYLLLAISLFLNPALYSQDYVTIQDRNIIVNHATYVIRGVCYNPIAKGNNQSNGMDFSHIDRDILLMKQANINTIRTYVPIMDGTVLDKFAAAGIKVIIGFSNYDDTYRYPDINHGSYLTYINTYKNHKAILMWELGNEYNYHPEWFNNDVNNWFSILNNAATAVHSADPNHPVSTAHGEVPAIAVLNACPAVDVWGMNVYRWDNPAGAITDFAARSTKPCYLSESGGDRYNSVQGAEDQQDQATANLTIWNHVKDNLNVCSGIAFFEFIDEWWKSGNNAIHDTAGFNMSIPYDNYANEEWWGIVDIDRNTTLAYDALKNSFTQFVSGINEITASDKYMLYPALTNDKVTITFPKPTVENIVLNITTVSGSQVVSEEMMVNGSSMELSLNRYHLPNGMYIVSVTGRSLKFHHVVVKQ